MRENRIAAAVIQLILNVMIISFAAQAKGQDKTVYEYWDKTGFGLHHAVDLLSNQNCYTNSRVFVGCMHALQRWASLIDDSLIWKHRSQIDSSDQLLMEKDFGFSVRPIEGDKYLVVDVDAQGPARRAGLKQDDQIKMSRGIDWEVDRHAGDTSIVRPNIENWQFNVTRIRNEKAQSLDLEKHALKFGEYRFVYKTEKPTQEKSLYDQWQKQKILNDQKLAQWRETYKKSKVIIEKSRQSKEIVGLIHFPYAAKRLTEFLPMSQRDKWAFYTGEIFNFYYQKTVDAHASFSPFQMVRDTQNADDEEIFGIGARINILEGRLYILSVMAGLGAYKAGLKPNDEIASINDISVSNLSIKEAVDLLKGPEGTTVQVQVRRNQQAFNVEIVRQRIMIKNVFAESYEAGGFRFGNIKIMSFNRADTCDDVEAAIYELQQKEVQGYIVDVRSNPGGLLNAATCITGLFVGKNKVAVFVRPNEASADSAVPPEGIHKTTRSSLLSENPAVPVVVLINGHSASASEILAGALQDHERAWIVGERSFGKGTAQAPKLVSGPGMPSRKLIQYRTMNRFYLPSNRTNQIVGIIPDFEVPMEPGATEEERFVLREAELYDNALEAIGKPWIQPRSKEVANVKACVEAPDSLVHLHQPSDKTDRLELTDYQRLYSAAILKCSLEENHADQEVR